LAVNALTSVCACFAYHVEWRLAPMLYDDAERATAQALRTSVVAKAQRSPSAIAMARRRTVSRVHRLLAELTTLGQNTLPGLGQKASAWISGLRAHRGKFGQCVTVHR
jgi:hypothetical protein